MNETKRNIAVGLFVILGTVLLGWLVLRFSSLVSLAGGAYQVSVRVENSHGASRGKAVHFNGVQVGTVDTVRLADRGRGVELVLGIREGIDIPRNAVLEASSTALGDPMLDIRLSEDPATRRPVEPAPPVPTDGTARLQGRSTTFQAALTQRLDSMMNRFSGVDTAINNLIEMTEPRSVEDVEQGGKPPNLSATVARIDQAVSEVASRENVERLGRILAELETATQRFNQTLGEADKTLVTIRTDVDKLTDESVRLLGKLTDDAAEVNHLLRSLQSLVKGVQEGEGTVGKLLTDDDLHDQIRILVLEAQLALKDFRVLTKKLEKEGVLRLGD